MHETFWVEEGPPNLHRVRYLAVACEERSHAMAAATVNGAEIVPPRSTRETAENDS